MIVDKCTECPLRSDDNETGSYCNAGHFDLYSYEDFPEKCPLLRGAITVSICENPKIGDKVFEWNEGSIDITLLEPYESPLLNSLLLHTKVLPPETAKEIEENIVRGLDDNG